VQYFQIISNTFFQGGRKFFQGGIRPLVTGRAGLTIVQTWQTPGALCFWGLAIDYQNTLPDYHVFRLFTTRQNCRVFWLAYCIQYRPIDWGNWQLWYFSLLSDWLKRIEPYRFSPVTSLGHQEGRRVFREGPKIFELCPIFLNYVQHIFPRGGRGRKTF